MAKFFPQLLRKLIDDYNPTNEPLYLDGVKNQADLGKHYHQND